MIWDPEAPQAVSFSTMGERQQALARVILEEPAVESLSSFIGVDGTNTTLNSGRMYINLKPLEERKAGAGEIIRRLEARVAEVDGITLYMQPVQDLTVEDRVSRTQFQYTLEDADPEELNRWAPKLVESLQLRPELRDVSSDQQNQGSGLAGGDRPQHRVPPGHYAATHHRYALRRLRSAAGFHHVHAVESVSRHSGGDAGISEGTGGPADAGSARQRRVGAVERVHPGRRKPLRRS